MTDTAVTIRIPNIGYQSIQEQREAARETTRLEMINRREQQRNNLRSAKINALIVDLNLAAFPYDCIIDYSSHPLVRIGQMDVVCGRCSAFKFAGELPGFCCLNGKVKLQLLTPPPKLWHSLLHGATQESRHCLTNTRKDNGNFQMTLYRAHLSKKMDLIRYSG